MKGERKQTKKIIDELFEVMPPEQVLDEHKTCFKKAKKTLAGKKEEYNECMESVLTREKRKEKYGF